MQHIPTVSGTSERPQRDWLPTVAYILMVALLLIIVGLLLWPSLTAVPPRNVAYINPEVRLAERYRTGEWVGPAVPGRTAPLYTEELALQQRQLAADLATNPELKYAAGSWAETRPMQDFAHANPEVDLFQRLQAFEE